MITFFFLIKTLEKKIETNPGVSRVIRTQPRSNRRFGRFFLSANGHTDGKTDDWTDPFIKIRGRMKKRCKSLQE